jgi:hypothetical protein
LLYSLLLLPCARLGEGKNYCVNSLSEIIQIQIHSSSTRAVALVVALIELLQTVSRSLLASFFSSFAISRVESSRVEGRGSRKHNGTAFKVFFLIIFYANTPEQKFSCLYIFSSLLLFSFPPLPPRGVALLAFHPALSSRAKRNETPENPRIFQFHE